MYDMAIERGFRLLSNGIRHVMPSTDRRLELKEKTLMAQTASQAVVYKSTQGVRPPDKRLCMPMG